MPVDAKWTIPQGTIFQLPSDEAVKWVKQMLESSKALKQLYKHFTDRGYTFYLERSKVFINVARDASDNVAPSVLGILPSFVPVTSVDENHAAVGISVHHSGYAMATSVKVSHKPFGVTEFSLYEVDPATKKIKTSTLSTEEVIEGSIGELAKKLHAPPVPKAGSRPKAGSVPDKPKGALANFTTIAPGNQGLLIGAVVQQLLADNFSRALFPPEYARALNMQTPTFQKFALATRERFRGTVLSITLCTSSSTSSNICTSTSTSSVEF